MLKRLCLLSLFVFFGMRVVAQLPTAGSGSQIQQVNVDNLSDDQIRQIVQQMKENNLGLDDVDTYAQQRGIPQDQVEKLKGRIAQLNLDQELKNNTGSNKTAGKARPVESRDRYLNDSLDYVQRTKASDWKDQLQEREKAQRLKKIFGSELFNGKNLSFEPNLNIPTPANYRLATNDELLIDVYGYSESQMKLKVSPDGYVRVPNLGPVYVNGLTIEQAKERLTKQLATIYGGIKTGQTSVSVSLGNIRSIRVLLIGEVNIPGTYTMPSLATVVNALYVSGGPSENGSFRDIQVFRNGSVAGTFDLYSFLMRGDLNGNLVLQDQDIIKVNPYDTRVELRGAVKRPAIFEAKGNESLGDILRFAGGFNDQAYRGVIKAYRVTDRERQVLTVPLDGIDRFQVKSGDIYTVDSVTSRFTNRVSITGAVIYPGEYQLENVGTVAGLIRRAGNLKEEANRSRGVIRRLQADYTPSMINFNVADVLAGTSDIPLQREDSVVVYSKLNLREDYQVKINGEVNNVGYFPYADSMHLEDLILLAGGLKDAATIKHVEVARRVRKDVYNAKDDTMAIVKQFDIKADLTGNVDFNFTLQPFDEVFVRKAPAYMEQAMIKIEGQVVYPGLYTLERRKEHISDLVQRSGGLRTDAYPEGAVLLRKTFTNSSDSALLADKLEIFYSKLKDSSSVERIRNKTTRDYQLLDINLEKILANPHSKYDLLVESGDLLQVPKRLQTVQVFGEIYFPKKERFDKTLSFRDYVRGAGGFTSQALRRRAYVVYANGHVRNTRKIFMFNRYPKIESGAEIYVPAKSAKSRLNAQEIVGLTTGFAALAAIIVSLLR